ncbi:MAG: hypothetical protein JXR96_27725 [Deltaproteobacteria bacterium]|nr:hypothetical protein [Deltaproteobacteria bacterium]
MTERSHLPVAVLALMSLLASTEARAGGAAVEAFELQQSVSRVLGTKRVQSRSFPCHLDVLNLRTRGAARAFKLAFRPAGDRHDAVAYYLVDRQALFERRPAAFPPMPLLTVTARSLVFGPQPGPAGSDALRSEIGQALAAALLLSACQAIETNRPPAGLPGDLRCMSWTQRRHYTIVEIALPGSRLPPDPAAALRPLVGTRMVHLLLVPDRGERLGQWFDAAVEAERDEGRPAPSPPPAPEPPFEDYRPKTSPDTALDYRPELRAALAALPPAEPAALEALFAALAEQQKHAREKPGRLVAGNPVLGAAPLEYVPSDPELLESEIGERIRRALPGVKAGQARAAIERAGFGGRFLVYRSIEFSHADVMGSGRFFYASEPSPRAIELP